MSIDFHFTGWQSLSTVGLEQFNTDFTFSLQLLVCRSSFFIIYCEWLLNDFSPPDVALTQQHIFWRKTVRQQHFSRRCLKVSSRNCWPCRSSKYTGRCWIRTLSPRKLLWLDCSLSACRRSAETCHSHRWECAYCPLLGTLCIAPPAHSECNESSPLTLQLSLGSEMVC